MPILLRWLAPFGRCGNKKEASRFRLASLTCLSTGIYQLILAKRLNARLRTSQNQSMNIVRAFIGIHRL
jgi:hypothetical protein